MASSGTAGRDKAVISTAMHAKELPKRPENVQGEENIGMDQPTSRPSTPPPVKQTVSQPPKTPEVISSSSEQRLQPPKTPSSASDLLHQASLYLSSPIRRQKNPGWLAPGTMTPGRSSLKNGTTGSHIFPQSPFKSTRAPGAGSVTLGPPQSIESLPTQTLMMTADQARELTDLEEAKTTLVTAIEEGEQFRKAAQHFRSLASSYAFQHKLVQVEKDESEQRFEVEASIQKREIEKLVVDIMGYTDKSIDTDQIRRKLKRMKQKVREMEALNATKDRQMQEMQAIIGQYARAQSMPTPSASVTQAAIHSQAPQVVRSSGAQKMLPAPSSPKKGESQPKSGKRHPPPINTQISSESSPTSSKVEPLSALEVLASQVLSNGIQHQDATPSKECSSSSLGEKAQKQTSTTQSTSSTYGNSPYESPFHVPFSPFAVPPQLPRPSPSSVPTFGSPEKRRRPSSSSTISAISEEDTIDDINNND